MHFLGLMLTFAKKFTLEISKELINQSLPEIFTTLIFMVVLGLVKFILKKLLRRFGRITDLLENRTLLIVKYINFLLGMVLVLGLLLIWGVNLGDVVILFSSVFAIIGVALFAQWSILSNITSGIILFFTFPIKIGDRIRIHDKDFPMDVTILDIKAFYLLLESAEGEHITYPNNLLLQKGVSILQHPADDKSGL